MRAVLFLLAGAAAAVGVARGWPQGQPNCGITGNWSDPERRERMSVSTGEIEGQKVHQVVFNSSGYAFSGSCPFEDGRSATLRVSGANESIQLNLVCHNNVMWIMQTPLLTSPRLMRVFTLTRLAPPPPPLPLAQPEADVGSNATDAPPRFLLVNITIPKRMSDDEAQHDDGREENDDGLGTRSCANAVCKTCFQNDDDYEENDPDLRTCGRKESCGSRHCKTCFQNDEEEENDITLTRHGNRGCRVASHCKTCSQNDDNEEENDIGFRTRDTRACCGSSD